MIAIGLLIFLKPEVGKGQIVNPFGDAVDGSVVVNSSYTTSSPYYVDDVRAKVTSFTTGSPTSTIYIGNQTGSFSVNDWAVIINMDPNCGTRNYSVLQIGSVGSNFLTTNSNILITSSSEMQIIQVKRFDSLTLDGVLSCHAFDEINGHGGYIFFFVRERLIFNTGGLIDGEGKGISGSFGELGGNSVSNSTTSGIVNSSLPRQNGGDASPTGGNFAATYGKRGYSANVDLGDSCDSYTILSGGNGGNGTVMYGNYGGIKPILANRCNSDMTNFLLLLGEGGVGGNGGRAPADGGAGGTSLGLNVATDGALGTSTSGYGGNGGDGGNGGAAVWIRAKIIEDNTANDVVINSSGTAGTAGTAGFGVGGDGGNGGNGENHGCTSRNNSINASGGGAGGKGGHGASGGNGGAGGRPGLVYIFTSTANNMLNTNSVASNGGVGGLGGSGTSAGASGINGTNGNPILGFDNLCSDCIDEVYSSDPPGEGGSGQRDTSDWAFLKDTNTIERVYECECFKIFKEIGLNIQSGITNLKSGGWGNSIAFNASFNGEATIIYIPNSPGIITLTQEYTKDDPIYPQYKIRYKDTYKCAYDENIGLGTMADFINDLNTNITLADISLNSPYASVDYTANNIDWEYFQGHYDARYLQNYSQFPPKIINLTTCSVIETSEDPIDGWDGLTGPTQEDLVPIYEEGDPGLENMENFGPEFSNIEENFTNYSNFKIFPNPAKDNFIISLDNFNSGKYNLELVNSKGVVVKTQEIVTNQGDESYSISIEGIAKGIYSVKVSNNKFSRVTSLIIK
jgi:hypothetical protein